MTAYPAAGDYYKAVQAPARVFTVPKLQAAEFVWDSLGPTLARGSSAVVFQASVEGQPQALRCYIRNDASSRDRYSALDAYLAANDLSRHVSGATWLDGAIQVNRATWPVLTMDWIDGRTLNEYVDFLVTSSDTAALTTLAAKWRALVALLQDSEFAHGDLQHGNVMVDQEGRLRLVDFDGVWIPPLAGQSPPTEFGHPNYQHPLQHVWDRWLDTFSALVIYLSLVALGKEPSLWLALYNSKNLLFAKSDFFPPFKTEAWKQLAAMGDPQVDELVRRLQECCDPDWVSTKSLEMTLDQQAVTPARRPIRPSSAGGRKSPWRSRVPRSQAPRSWVPRSRVPRSAGSAVAGSAADGPASRPRPQGTPSAVPPATRDASRGHSRGAGRDREDCGGFAAGPATAVRAARPGGYRTDAATEPDDGTPGRHHLVVRVVPRSASAQGRPGPVPHGSVPPGPGPHGSVPPGPVPHGSVPPAPGTRMPGPSASAPPASATKSRPGPVAGAIALGLGILLLLIGAVGHVAIIVIGGLVAAAWGMWRLATGTGTGNPNRLARRDVAYVTTHCSCFQYVSRSPSFVPTMTAMTCG